MFGDTLRQARGHKGVTLLEAARATRINRNYLAALEDERFENLPALPYQRGIVRSYAVFLGLDPVKLVGMFEEARGLRPEDPQFLTPLQPAEMPSNFTPNFAVIAFVLVLSAVAFTWFYSVYSGSPTATVEPALVFPTVTPVSKDAIYVQPGSEATPEAETAEPAPTSATEIEPASGTETDGAESESPSTEDAAANSDNDEADSEEATSLSISALSEIEIEVVVDDIFVYEGTLQSGESTEWFTGSGFTVLTSSGVNTQFMGESRVPFLMGDEDGQVIYTLDESDLAS